MMAPIVPSRPMAHMGGQNRRLPPPRRNRNGGGAPNPNYRAVQSQSGLVPHTRLSSGWPPYTHQHHMNQRQPPPQGYPPEGGQLALPRSSSRIHTLPTAVCVCKGPPDANGMIKCANPECGNGEIFHLQCMELTRLPAVGWMCPECRKCK
eukprot:GHVO01012665.1.p1 GENE.GHVO01012665.1~~GHVO01012665.1.p1  ORF type:complete len:150 (+),score=20.08 GHVO01012665.1:475-924(+)